MRVILVTAAIVAVGIATFGLSGCTGKGTLAGAPAVTVYDKKEERLRGWD